MDGTSPLHASRAAIIGIAGVSLDRTEAALLREHPPLGAILFRRNIVSPAQLAELVAALRETLPPGALLMVDQEGGRVARLRPPHWLAHPAAATIGQLHASDPKAGLRAARLTGTLIGLDCARAGFDVVCAPVLDRTIPGAHEIIGDRAFGADARTIVPLATAFADGLLAAGIQPVGKHAPGHGRASLDSHFALPELDRIEDADLAPFAAMTWLPWLMTAHIRYHADDPLAPATLSRPIIQHVLRTRLGYHNLLVSDDLAMHALGGLAGTRSAGERAARTLAAGCDIALHCSGVFDDTRDVLTSIPALDEAALSRLGRARELALSHRNPGLDAAALASERERLLC